MTRANWTSATAWPDRPPPFHPWKLFFKAYPTKSLSLPLYPTIFSLYPSGLSHSLSRGLAEIPLSTRDLNGAGTLQALLVGSGAFVDAHPDITERLLKVQLQAQDWLAREENRDAYIELVSKQASYPVVILQSEYRGRKLGDALSPRLDADFLGRLDASIQAAKRFGLIRREFSAEQWAAPELLEAAGKLAKAKAKAVAQAAE